MTGRPCMRLREGARCGQARSQPIGYVCLPGCHTTLHSCRVYLLYDNLLNRSVDCKSVATPLGYRYVRGRRLDVSRRNREVRHDGTARLR